MIIRYILDIYNISRGNSDTPESPNIYLIYHKIRQYIYPRKIGILILAMSGSEWQQISILYFLKFLTIFMNFKLKFSSFRTARLPNRIKIANIISVLLRGIENFHSWIWQDKQGQYTVIYCQKLVTWISALPYKKMVPINFYFSF
jgi:hypothetical protein